MPTTSAPSTPLRKSPRHYGAAGCCHWRSHAIYRSGDALKLLMHDRDKLVERRLVAAAPGAQQGSYVGPCFASRLFVHASEYTTRMGVPLTSLFAEIQLHVNVGACIFRGDDTLGRKMVKAERLIQADRRRKLSIRLKIESPGAY